jgi:hypothetical protein
MAAHFVGQDIPPWRWLLARHLAQMLHQLGMEDSAADNYSLIHPAIVPAGTSNVYSARKVIRSRGQRRYECRPEQLRVLCGNVVLREQVIKPVLAGLAHQELPPPPPKLSAIDQHYLALRAELQRTCQTLGFAA